MIHRHPPVAADGTSGRASSSRSRASTASSSTRTRPGQPNFQLFSTIDACRSGHGAAAAAVQPDRRGRRVPLHDAGNAEAQGDRGRRSSTINVTDPQGRPARFTPWYGALAHAIFFRAGTLDYFHTHVCAPGASGCTSVLGATQVKGSSTTPGKLRVGVLVPVAGDVAPVPADPRKRACAHRSLHPGGQVKLSVTTLVAVAVRARLRGRPRSRTRT